MLAPQAVAGEPENMEIEEDVDFEADDAEDVEPSAATPPPERDTKLRRDDQKDEPAERVCTHLLNPCTALQSASAWMSVSRAKQSLEVKDSCNCVCGPK